MNDDLSLDGCVSIVTHGGSYFTEELVLITNGCGILTERPFPTQGGEVCAWVMLEENVLEKVYMTGSEFEIRNQSVYGLFRVIYLKYDSNICCTHWYPINEKT
jgi:hypothetical protein